MYVNSHTCMQTKATYTSRTKQTKLRTKKTQATKTNNQKNQDNEMTKNLNQRCSMRGWYSSKTIH